MNGTSRIFPGKFSMAFGSLSLRYRDLCVDMLDLGGGQNLGRSCGYFRRRERLRCVYGARWHRNGKSLQGLVVPVTVSHAKVDCNCRASLRWQSVIAWPAD
jgi:hypothetical protein